MEAERVQKIVGAGNKPQMVVLYFPDDKMPSRDQAQQFVDMMTAKCNQAGWGAVPVLVMPDYTHVEFVQPLTMVLPPNSVVEHEKYEGYERTIAYPVGQRPDIEPWKDNAEMKK